jgi:hypothetical protein
MTLTHRRLGALLASAALAAGAVAGCGDDEEPAAAGQETQAEAAPASPADEAGEANVTVAEVLRAPDEFQGEQVRCPRRSSRPATA